MSAPIHLRAGGTSLVIEHSDGAAPSIFYWGTELAEVDTDEFEEAVAAAKPQHRVGDIDEPVPVSLLPSAAEGWTGAPALEGHRDGRDFSPAFPAVAVSVDGACAVFECEDQDAALRVTLEVEVRPSGLVRQRVTVRNAGADPYTLLAVRATFPVPDTHDELLHPAGRWMRERSPQRQPFTVGRLLRESRKGRPGADAPLVVVSGDSGFGFDHGDVRAVHLGWSGNSELGAERSVLRGRVLSGGELFMPGEVELSAGESYTAPWLYGSWGDGLDAMARRFHSEVREESRVEAADLPVVMNVWEAVYFEHDLDVLVELAGLGAAVGAEVFVLDDGWFRGRRDDHRALGDWEVDPVVWPQGLEPLIKAVTAHGMRFGIWVEPEMISVDSDLARAHPEWILRPGIRLPPESRWQQVLDLSHPDAFHHVLEAIDELLSAHGIAYVKWDHNRDSLEAGSSLSGRSAAGANTRALYRLLDTLRARHPQVLFENCASGGSRIDLGILSRTDRTWVSDTADPLERVAIQQYTGLLLPVGMTGNDITAPAAHTTGRVSSMDLRGSVALLGHLGIQWDLRQASSEEREELAEWVARFKRLRGLLWSGDLVNFASPDPSLVVRGVIAADLGEAVLTFVQTASTFAPGPGRVRVPGLDPVSLYDVRVDTDPHRLRSRAYTPAPWVVAGTRLSGAALAAIGLEAPVIDPEQGFVVTIRRV